MARSYTRIANLCALPLKSGCPEVIHHSRLIFKKLLSPQIRDSLVMDMHTIPMVNDAENDVFDDNLDEGTARPVPTEIRNALNHTNLNVPSRVIFQTSITINGLRYAIASKHPGNSCVMLLSAGGGSPQPAQLNYILEFRTSKNPLIYLAVRRYKPSHIKDDPFAKYPVLCAKLWDSHLADVEIITTSQVLSHFACLPIQMQRRSLVAVLSLSRVS